jgi:microcompartment protein CcmK/EutM
VLVVQGSVASAWFGESHPPVDALIIGSVDPQESSTTVAATAPGAPPEK